APDRSRRAAPLRGGAIHRHGGGDRAARRTAGDAQMKGAYRLAAVAFLLAIAGCATLEAPLSMHLGSPTPALRECAAWFRALDAQIDAAGVRDGQYAAIAGFPYLRADRLHASLRERAAARDAALYALADR